MSWIEWGVIVLWVLMVLTWLWGAIRGDERDSEILGLRRDLVNSTTDAKHTASMASHKASDAKMEAMKALDMAREANEKLDKHYVPITLVVDRHEEKFHPNELKRLELQQQNKESEAQAARKAINPELI